MNKVLFAILIVLIPVINLQARDGSKRNDLRESSSNNLAPLISVFVPGGGHFYLGENETGAFYAVSEVLLVGSSIYCISKWDPNIFGDNKNTDNYMTAALVLGTAFVTVKVFDVIHAARTAQDKNRQDQLSMGFDLDSQKQIMPKLTYSYNF